MSKSITVIPEVFIKILNMKWHRRVDGPRICASSSLSRDPCGLQALNKLLAYQGAGGEYVRRRDFVELAFKYPTQEFLGKGLVLGARLVPILGGTAGRSRGRWWDNRRRGWGAWDRRCWCRSLGLPRLFFLCRRDIVHIVQLCGVSPVALTCFPSRLPQ